MEMFTKEFIDKMTHAKRKRKLKNWLSQLDGQDSESDNEMESTSSKHVRIIDIFYEFMSD